MFIKSINFIFNILILLNLHQSTTEEVSNSDFISSLLCTETIFDEVREIQMSDLDRRRKKHKEDLKEKNDRRNNSIYWIQCFNEKEIKNRTDVNFISKNNNRKKLKIK